MSPLEIILLVSQHPRGAKAAKQIRLGHDRRWFANIKKAYVMFRCALNARRKNKHKFGLLGMKKNIAVNDGIARFVCFSLELIEGSSEKVNKVKLL
jgi:hypothetical protein